MAEEMDELLTVHEVARRLRVDDTTVNTLAQYTLGWHPETTFNEGVRRVVEAAQWRASQSSRTYKDIKELLERSTFSLEQKQCTR